MAGAAGSGRDRGNMSGGTGYSSCQGGSQTPTAGGSGPPWIWTSSALAGSRGTG